MVLQLGTSELISHAGVTLTSSDASVVSISEDGTATANGLGMATVTADDGQGNTAVCTVVVADSEPVSGDCNLDGKVNAIDAVYILNLAATLGVEDIQDQFSDSYMKLYDFNKDGIVNSFDANDVLVTSAFAGIGYNS